MPVTSEVLARLGIDTKDIPKDLADANRFFTRFSKDIEKQSEKAGAEGGKKFANAFGSQLAGQARGAIFAALGLSAQGIADQIAAAFVGGTKEAWKSVGEIADANSALIGEKIAENLTPKQFAENLQKQFEAAQAAYETLQQSTGGKEDAESREKLLKAQNTVLVLERKLIELRKEDRKAAEESDEIQRKFLNETLDKQTVLRDLKDGESRIQARITTEALTERQLYEERGNLLNQQLEIRKLEADIASDIAETERKAAEEKRKILEFETKKRTDIARLEDRAKTIGTKINEGKTALGDRSKTTIGELANLSNFGAGVSIEAGAAGAKAREVLALEQAAEAARLRGDQAGVGESLTQAGALRDQLVSSGFAKSTEADGSAAIVAELEEQTTELKTVLEQIREIEKGRYVNK